ncbi:MAG: STAS/SEC14 domain-containing protein [Pseudomonadota bacterium]
MTIQVEFSAPNRVDVHVSGLMLRDEVDASKHLIHDLMRMHGKCLIMIRLDSGLQGMQALVRWDDIDVDHYIKENIIRMAVVGDLRWRDSALLYLLNSMVPFQIEYFPAAQDVLATAWLTQ